MVLPKYISSHSAGAVTVSGTGSVPARHGFDHAGLHDRVLVVEGDAVVLPLSADAARRPRVTASRYRARVSAVTAVRKKLLHDRFGRSLLQNNARVVDNRGVAAPSGIPETAPEARRGLRVVLADDDVLLREGLASLLERSGFDVAGQAGNGPELLALVRSARPELAIIDIRMPPGHATEGLQAAQVIRAELPGTAIIVLSAHVEVEEAMELLAGGQGTGYLLKSRVTDVAEFIETVGRIAAGGSVVDPSLVQELIRARKRRDPLDVLSPREREVLALMAEGASNAGIARRIFVTEGTVEKHVRSILTKLDLPESDTEHRRVLAVLRFLEAR
jgi:DNA-binding NarL/FixJ family response regulator